MRTLPKTCNKMPSTFANIDVDFVTKAVKLLLDAGLLDNMQEMQPSEEEAWELALEEKAAREVRAAEEAKRELKKVHALRSRGEDPWGWCHCLPPLVKEVGETLEEETIGWQNDEKTKSPITGFNAFCIMNRSFIHQKLSAGGRSNKPAAIMKALGKLWSREFDEEAREGWRKLAKIYPSKDALLDGEVSGWD